MGRVVVLFSGGIDSTAALYRVLTEYPEFQVLVHHVKLMTSENRHQAEAIAVKGILKWLRKKQFNFRYEEMEFKSPYPLWDAHIYGMTTGAICMITNDITHFATGATYTTYDDQGRNVYPGPGEDHFKQIVSLHAGREIEVLPVFRNDAGEFLSKQEAWDYIPDAIKPNIWSCRRPEYSELGATRCHKCLTCRDLNQLKPRPRNNLTYQL
jgi:hypothetical protein